MKHIIALASGMAASIAMGFMLAVILGIFNLYLAGHGIHWPSEEFVNWHSVRLSPLDAILLAGCFVTFMVTYGLVLHAMKSKSAQTHSMNEP